MKRILFLIFCLTFLFDGIGQRNKTIPGERTYCKKLTVLLNSHSYDPVFDLNISKGKDTVSMQLIKVYGKEFIAKNPSLKMRIPQTISNRKILLGVRLIHGMSKPDLISNGVYLRRKSVRIMINSNDDFLIDGKISHLDSVQKIVENYFSKIGTDYEYPETVEQSKIIIKWDENTTPYCFEQTLKRICYGYLNFIENNSN